MKDFRCTIRPYRPADEPLLMALLATNTPAYFAPEEAEEFRLFLHQAIEYYFVAELTGAVVGSGGFNLLHNGTHARLSWDMVHPAQQGKLIGHQLLTHRLNEIGRMSAVKTIDVRTSQWAWRFYEKAGFRLVETLPDYWAKGLHLYHMVYEGKEI
jgi:ribosomal protein S18 acetylase RimI-like enzyme